jgi:hypothetical protein
MTVNAAFRFSLFENLNRLIVEISFVFSGLLSSLALCGAAVSSDVRVIGAGSAAVNPLHDKTDISAFWIMGPCGKLD